MTDYRHVIPISGKDSAATAIVQQAYHPEYEYEYIYNDTFSELPEVDVWLKKMESYLNKPIVRIGANLEDIIYDQGILPSRRVRFCTRLSKIYPMEDYFSKQNRPVKLYLGIRADEQRVGYQTTRSNIESIYPLQEMGINLQLVYEILDARQLTPPDFHWESLYRLVLPYFGILDENYFMSRLNRSEKTMLFSWRSRLNCYFCFFQQIWEWVGLLEHHPDLFAQAERIENEIGAEGYSWRQDWSLAKIRENAAAIKIRRARKVARTIMKIVGAKTEHIEDDPDEEDGLSVVSCGLFCGK